MKVLGQLEVAQLENVSGNPAISPRGRIILDITTPAKGVPKYFDGTVWKILSSEPLTSTVVVSPDTNGNYLVDWSLGRTQKITFGFGFVDQPVISFTNPQEGKEHTLIISQPSTGGPNNNATVLYTLNMPDQSTNGNPYQPVLPILQGSTLVYKWMYSAGLENAITAIPPYSTLAQTVPLAAPAGMDLSPDGKMLAMGSTASPFYSFYLLGSSIAPDYQNILVSRNLFTPTTAAGAINGVAYHPDGTKLFVASTTTPFIQCFALDRNTPNGTNFANPGTLPTGSGNCVAVSPRGGSVVIGHATTPFMSGYPIQTNAFGGKYANPSTLPAAQVSGISFAKTGNYVAVVYASTPFLTVYSFSESGGFGTALSPSSLPPSGPNTSAAKCVAFRPQSDYVAMTCGANGVIVYPFDKNLFTLGTPVSYNFGVTANAVQWSPDGQFLVVTLAASPGLAVFDFSSFSLTAPLIFDGSSPGAAIVDVTVHPSGLFMFLAGTAPSLSVWGMPKKQKNYVRYTP